MLKMLKERLNLNKVSVAHDGNEVGEEYLADMVVDNGDGTFTVTFPGYDEPIIVTQEMLDDVYLPDTISSTNPDLENLLPILEAAYLQIHAKENAVVDPFDLFLGDDAKVYLIHPEMIDGPFFDELQSQARGGRDLLITGYVHTDVTITTIDVPPVEILMDGRHEYTIQYEDGHYYIINPHDTSERYEISESQVQETFSRIVISPAPGVDIDIPEHMQATALAAENVQDSLYELFEIRNGAYSITEFGNIENDPYDNGRLGPSEGLLSETKISIRVEKLQESWRDLQAEHGELETSTYLSQDINTDHAITSAAYAIVLTDLNNPDLKENALEAMRELVPEHMSQETYDAVVAEVERLDGNLLLDDNGNSVFDSPEEALAALLEGTHPNSELQAAWNDTSHVTNVIADPSIHDDFGRNLGQALVSVENGNLDPRLPGDRTFPEGSGYYDVLLSSGYQTAAHHNERDYEPSSPTIPDITIPDITFPNIDDVIIKPIIVDERIFKS